MSDTTQDLKVTVEPTGRTRNSGEQAGAPVYSLKFADGRSMIPNPTAADLEALNLVPPIPLPPEPEGTAFAVDRDGRTWRSSEDAFRQAPGIRRWFRPTAIGDWTPTYLTWDRLNTECGPLKIYTESTP